MDLQLLSGLVAPSAKPSWPAAETARGIVTRRAEIMVELCILVVVSMKGLFRWVWDRLARGRVSVKQSSLVRELDL